MASLKGFIDEIHRRALWQVLTAYLGASWIVMEVTDQFTDRFLLPDWVYQTALVLLVIGLPIVLATALVREEKREAKSQVRDPMQLGDVSLEAAAQVSVGSHQPISRLLTWPRAILGGALAFAVLTLVSAVIVMQGTARVTQAHGAAGDAFEERAWIVVADFEASRDEAETALAAQTALTFDLQQSEYVNVRSRNQIAPVLTLMGLPDTVSVTEQLALELAQREGLAAVLAASVSRLGKDYLLAARVIEPRNLEELIAVRSVVGEARLVEGVETLSRELRKRLGEEGSSIRGSKALPRVTTRSLEALKKYAQGQEAVGRFQDWRTAAELAAQAVALDSSFASAYSLAAVAFSNMERAADASANAQRAYELRDRMSDYERLRTEAFYQYAVEGDPRAAANTYEIFLSQYPDADVAANNLAVFAGAYVGEYERAFVTAIKALELDPYSANSYNIAIGSARWTDRWSVVDSLIQVAYERGFDDLAVREQREQALLHDDWARAEALCDSLLAEPAGPGRVFQDRSFCGASEMALGRISNAITHLEGAVSILNQFGQYSLQVVIVEELIRADQLRGRPDAARARVEAWLADIDAGSVGELDRALVRYVLLTACAQLGAFDLMERIDAAYSPDRDLGHRMAQLAIGQGDAARALAEGRPEIALAELRRFETFGLNGPFVRPYTDLVYAQVFDALTEADSAIAYFEAFVHPIVVSMSDLVRTHYPVVVRRLAELEESRGNTDAAIGHYRRFLELWSDADPELLDQVTSARRALARLTAETS